MSYYDEIVRTQSSFSMPGISGRTVADYGYLRGYRSRHPANISAPVSEHEADPFAGFLSRVYNARKDPSATYVADTGHTLTSIRHSSTLSDVTTRSKSGTLRPYHGVVIVPSGAAPALGTWGDSYSRPSIYTSDLAAFGQQAMVSRVEKPTELDITQSLAELLREGVPRILGASLWKARLKDVPGKAGGEFLNYQFAWRPLLDDIQAAVKVVLDLDAILARRRKEVGVPQRVSFAPPALLAQDTQTFSSLVMSAQGGDVFPPSLYSVPLSVRRFAYANLTSQSITTRGMDGWDVSIIRSQQRVRKFSGSFTTNFDYPAPDAQWIEKAKALLGAQVTPATLWELTPWSWLVDWFFRIKTTIQANLIADDKRVVMNYGYVSQEDTLRMVITGEVSERGSSGDSAFRAKFSTVQTHVFRHRLRANPFGFQVASWSGFTPSQVAILAALGISKI